MENQQPRSEVRRRIPTHKYSAVLRQVLPRENQILEPFVFSRRDAKSGLQLLRQYIAPHLRGWRRCLFPGQLPSEFAAYTELRSALGLLRRGCGEEQPVFQF